MLERKVEIMETMLRDGLQTKKVFLSPKQRIFLAEYLHNLGADRIEIANATRKPVPEDTLAVKESVKWAKKEGCLDSLEVLCFMKEKDEPENTYAAADWVVDTGCKNINLLAKGSKNHVDIQFGEPKKQYLSRLTNSITHAREKGLNVRMYLEAWSEGMNENPQFVYDTIRVAADKGVKRFILCDTMGVLSPEKTYNFVKKIIKKFPKLEFEFHGHNDYQLAVANSCAAVKAGCLGVNVAALGLGERAGNADLFLVHAALKDHYNCHTSLDESKFKDAADIISSLTGISIPDNYPIFGSNAFAHGAGVHADGHSKGNIYTNDLFPPRFGNFDVEYVLGDKAGTKTVKKHLDKLGISLDKDSLSSLTQEVRDLSKSKNITTHDLLFMLPEVMGQSEGANRSKMFYFIDKNVGSSGGLGAHASFRAVYKGKEISGFGRGNGQVNAFMNGLRDTVVFEENPELKEIAIYNYSITTPEAARSESVVKCNIEWQYNGSGKRFETNGYDTDQAFAPIEAIEKMINLELYLKEKENNKQSTQQV